MDPLKQVELKPREEARAVGTVVFSLGYGTTEQEIDRAIEALSRQFRRERSERTMGAQ